jgi:prepilin-type N-terminal cleavage/methylation domain-containing protein
MGCPVSVQGVRIVICSPNRRGFVLAEVLVVAVIAAALAAVAIPIYSGMVKNQRRDATRNIAQTAAMSANVYTRRIGTAPICASTTTCSTLLGLFIPDPTKYSITIQAAPNFVTVSDISRGTSDSVTATAGF